MRNIFLLLLIGFVLFACKNTTIEKIDEVYENEQPKVVIVFKIENNDTIKVEEKVFFEDGKLKLRGTIKNNLRDGKWEAFFNDGTTQSEGYFKNGLRHGAAKVYYPNKKLMYEGTYNEGIETGNWKFYNEKGEIVNEKKFSLE